MILFLWFCIFWQRIKLSFLEKEKKSPESLTKSGLSHDPEDYVGKILLVTVQCDEHDTWHWQKSEITNQVYSDPTSFCLFFREEEYERSNVYYSFIGGVLRDGDGDGDVVGFVGREVSARHHVRN